MIVCDLCDRPRECLQKDIDGREYDICAECWDVLAAKLKGKGRDKKNKTESEPIFLPTVTKEPERSDPKPPGEPPKIWAGLRPQ